MRVADVQRQFRYWGRFPTVRDMVAGYLGVESRPANQPPVPKTEAEFKRAMTMHGVPNGG